MAHLHAARHLQHRFGGMRWPTRSRQQGHGKDTPHEEKASIPRLPDRTVERKRGAPVRTRSRHPWQQAMNLHEFHPSIVRERKEALLNAMTTLMAAPASMTRPMAHF